MTTFPDMIVTMDEVRFGASTSIFRWTLTGTNTGRGGNGNRVRISGYEEWRFSAENLIAESKGHFDAAKYAHQLEHGVES